MTKIVNRVKRIVRMIVNYTLILLGLCALAYVVYTGYVVYMSMTNESEPAPALEPIQESIVEQVKEQVQPKSDVEQAQTMLAEATAKLDAEEERLLAEIADIENKAAAEVAERQAALDEINEIRASF